MCGHRRHVARARSCHPPARLSPEAVPAWLAIVPGLPGQFPDYWWGLVVHHGLTDRLDRVDQIFLRLNLLLLLAVSFLPFPTRLVADALEKNTSWQRVAAVVYGLTLLAIRLLFAGLGGYARRERLRRPGADDPDLQDAHKKFRIAVGGYVVTICLGLVVPIVAIVLYFAIAIFLLVPFGAVGREVFGKRS